MVLYTSHITNICYIRCFYLKISKYDQETPQSHIADQPTEP